MKKYIFYTLSFFISMLSVAQTRVITGTIKDINTKEPIDRVSISITGTNMRSLSNEEGEFKIEVPEGHSKLSFYHLSYTEKNYEVLENNSIQIFLTPKEYLLDEVVINRQSSVRDTLAWAVYYSRVAIQKTLLLRTYYREFTKVDDKYTCFTDGVLDYYNHIEGKKHSSFQSDLYVLQSRVCDLLPSNSSEKLKRQLQNQSNEDVRRTVLNAYKFDILDDIMWWSDECYDFKIVTKKETNGNNIKVVTVTPKKGIIMGGLYTGTITYDSKTKLILDIDLKYSPEHKKYATTTNFWFIRRLKFRCNENARKASFKLDGNKYVMLYDQRTSNLYIKIGNKIEAVLESIYDITTLDYKEGNFNLDSNKKYKEETLSANGNKYTENFWEIENVMPLSDKEEAIVRELNEKSMIINPDKETLQTHQ